jgi:hypothetical protein
MHNPTGRRNPRRASGLRFPFRRDVEAGCVEDGRKLTANEVPHVICLSPIAFVARLVASWALDSVIQYGRALTGSLLSEDNPYLISPPTWWRSEARRGLSTIDGDPGSPQMGWLFSPSSRRATRSKSKQRSTTAVGRGIRGAPVPPA